MIIKYFYHHTIEQDELGPLNSGLASLTLDEVSVLGLSSVQMNATCLGMVSH